MKGGGRYEEEGGRIEAQKGKRGGNVQKRIEAGRHILKEKRRKTSCKKGNPDKSV